MDTNWPLTFEDINDFLQTHDVPMGQLDTAACETRVLFELIKYQAEQLADLKADVERLADLSGLGDCL